MAKNIVTSLEKKALGMSFLALAAIPVILASSCTVRRVVGFSPVAAQNRSIGSGPGGPGTAHLAGTVGCSPL